MNLIGHVLNTDLFYSIERKCILSMAKRNVNWLSSILAALWETQRYVELSAYSTKSIHEPQASNFIMARRQHVTLAHAFSSHSHAQFYLLNTYSWIAKVMRKQIHNSRIYGLSWNIQKKASNLRRRVAKKSHMRQTKRERKWEANEKKKDSI